MGRIRTIKPELLDDEIASGLTDAAWRMFVSSWLLADDHGNLRAGSKYLAANVYQDTTRDAEEPLKELVSKGRLRLYHVDGQRYATIVNWAKHQRMDNASKVRLIPAPTDNREDSDHSTASRGDSPQSAETRGVSRLDPDPDPDQEPDPDHKDPSQVSVREVWDHFMACRSKVTTKNPPKLDVKRKRHIKARIEAFGTERVLAAVDRFFAAGSWYVANNRLLPDYIFDSNERLEKVEASQPVVANLRGQPQGTDRADDRAAAVIAKARVA